MNILEIAINAAGSPAGLAAVLDVDRQNVNNWKRRGAPHMVLRAIKAIYAKEISQAVKAQKAEAGHSKNA